MADGPSALRCQVYFPVSDLAQSGLPAKAIGELTDLAKKGGSPDEVDSCDLEKLYEESPPAIPENQLHGKYQFMETAQNSAGEARLSFNYRSFFGRFLQAKHFGFASVRQLAEDEARGGRESESKYIKKLTGTSYADALKRVPQKFQKSVGFQRALKELFVRYPFRSAEIEQEDGRNDLVSFGMDLDSTVACGGMGCMPIAGYEILMLDGQSGSYLVAEFDPQWKIKVQFFDATGKQLWWINADLSCLMRTDQNPYGIPEFFYRSYLSGRDKYFAASRRELQDIPITVSTNMGRGQWEEFKKGPMGHDKEAMPLYHLISERLDSIVPEK